MIRASPWEKLGADEARRTDSEGKYDFFWVVSEHGFPGLMLRLSSMPEPALRLPNLRNLKMTFRATHLGIAFLIVLEEPSQSEIFEILCRDVVTSVEAEKDLVKGVEIAIQRTLRWHHLLRGGRLGALSPEEQQGLVGELAFLRELVGAFGADAAIEAWTGPQGAVKDFEFIGTCIELKTRRVASRASISISSAEQLADVEGCKLFLRVTNVASAFLPEGHSLHDHVLATSELFKEAGRAFFLWEQAIYSTGYSPTDNYDGKCWKLGSSVDFKVSTGFPRISPPLPVGLSNVRYSVLLDACSVFEIKEDLMDIIRKGADI